jgi:hypothetical protein
MGAGRWFGNYETPCVISKIGAEKLANGQVLNTTSYGRKESEGKDFNEDTNFGKLKRTPLPALQTFLKKCIEMDGHCEIVYKLMPYGQVWRHTGEILAAGNRCAARKE